MNGLASVWLAIAIYSLGSYFFIILLIGSLWWQELQLSRLSLLSQRSYSRSNCKV